MFSFSAIISWHFVKWSSGTL